MFEKAIIFIENAALISPSPSSPWTCQVYFWLWSEGLSLCAGEGPEPIPMSGLSWLFKLLCMTIVVIKITTITTTMMVTWSLHSQRQFLPWRPKVSLQKTYFCKYKMQNLYARHIFVCKWRSYWASSISKYLWKYIYGMRVQHQSIMWI